MLRNHKQLILNRFKADGRLSSGTVEGFNLKAKLTTRKAYGYKSLECLQTALYHTLGNLPEPILTHKFCGRAIKMRTSDGTVLGAYDVGINPRGVIFDGANVWVVNYDSGTITKL